MAEDSELYPQATIRDGKTYLRFVNCDVYVDYASLGFASIEHWNEVHRREFVSWSRRCLSMANSANLKYQNPNNHNLNDYRPFDGPTMEKELEMHIKRSPPGVKSKIRIEWVEDFGYVVLDPEPQRKDEDKYIITINTSGTDMNLNEWYYVYGNKLEGWLRKSRSLEFRGIPPKDYLKYGPPGVALAYENDPSPSYDLYIKRL